MERIDFKAALRDEAWLYKLNTDVQNLLSAQAGQEAEIRAACETVLRGYAAGQLASVSVEELRKSRTGIRVAALQEAGFTNLGKILQASDWELAQVEGIGEKQVAALRNITAEFASHITKNQSVRLVADDWSPENAGLITALARYRKGQAIRRDVAEPAAGLASLTEKILAGFQVRSRLAWIFSGRAKKEATLQALTDLGAFRANPLCARIMNLLSLYETASRLGTAEAMADFRENGAEYYALLEKFGGVRPAARLVYSSVPAQLAQAIDEMPLDLSCFRGDLRAYQAFGAKYVLTQKRVLLGDEMGLGKTVEAIAAMAHLEAQSPGCHFLIVCPATVLVNWCREIRKFSSIEPFLLHGNQLEAAFAAWQEQGGAAVTNYESMGKIAERIDNRMYLEMLVIDEAHYIKNPEAMRTRLVRMLDEEAQHVLMMTGTPLENRVEEMCELLSFANPALAREARKYAYMSSAPQFRELLAPVYLRRQREQVLTELPPLEEREEWCLMTPADLTAYLVTLPMRNFTALRRVSFLQDDLSNSAKAQRLLAICEEAAEAGRKTVVFSYFRETIEKARALLGTRVLGEITGSTDIGARQILLDHFRDAAAGSVLLCQVQAGGTGLNIQTASVVVFTEPQIKPSLTKQAIARVYRMGQVQNVLVYHLLCAETVDEAMVRLVKEKQNQFDVYADESAMGEATESLFDRDWIREFMEEENQKYLPMVIPAGS